MMNFSKMQHLKDMMCKELDTFADRNELNATTLDAIHKLTAAIKNIDKIEMMNGDGESYYGRYDDGMSERNRRGTHYVRGHYSNRYDDGYSRADAIEKMREKFEKMLREATTEDERRVINHCMSQINYLD